MDDVHEHPHRDAHHDELGHGLCPNHTIEAEDAIQQQEQRNIEDELMRLLTDTGYRSTMSADYAAVRTALETRETVRSTAAAYAAECILGKIKA